MVENDWKGNSELSRDAEFGLYQITQAAQQRRIPILAAGDVFSSRTPSRDMMIKTGDYLPNVTGYYIQGNHDRIYPSWMRLVARHWIHLQDQPVELAAVEKDLFDAAEDDRLELESEPLFESDRTWHVYGLDYILSADLLRQRLEELEAAIEATPEIARLIVLHQGFPPLTPPGTSELLDGMIPDCFDLAVVGHVHEAGIFSIKTRAGRDIPIVSPGGHHLTAIDQNPNKKLYLMYADGSVRSLPLLTRAKMVVDFSGASADEIRRKASEIVNSFSTMKKRPEAVQTPILHVLYDGATSPDVETILAETCREKAHLFFRNTAKEQKNDSTESNVLEEIDVQRHAVQGTEYAKEIFHKIESDPEIRSLVEQFLDREAGRESYETIKLRFQERHHASNPQRRTGELLPT